MENNDLVEYENNSEFTMSHYPAVKILFFTAIGMLLNTILQLSALTICLIILLYFIFCLVFRNRYLLTKIIIGGILVGISLSSRIGNYELNIPDKTIPDMPALIRGEIKQIITLKDTRARLIINGSIDTKQLEQINSIKIILDIYKLKNSDLELKTGYEIYAATKARFPKKKILDDDFDEAFYAKFNDVNWFASAPAKDVKITKRKITINGFFEPVINAINNQIEIVFPNNTVGIVKALVTGDKSGLSQELKQAYSYTGTAHVLAVSGLHVGIISAILGLFLSVFDNRKLKFSIFTILIIIYMFITGVQPSVIRAGIMSIAIYYAYTLERIIQPINALSFVVLLLIIFDPMIIYSPGFQMSIASVYGILLCYLPFKNTLGKIIGTQSGFQNFIASSLAVTLSASIIVTPIVAYYFKIYSIISPLTNLIIVPLTSLAMIYAFIALIISTISLSFGQYFAYSADLLLDISNSITLFAQSIPYSYIWSEYSVYLASILSALFLYVFISKNKKILAFRTIVSIVLFLLTWNLLPEYSEIKTQIVPFKDCVLLKHNIDTTTSFYWIADRKPNNYSAADFGIYNILKKSDKKIIVAVNGNIGLATIDKLKNEKKFSAIELNIESQKLIEKYFHLKISLPQFIKEEVLWH